MDVLNKIIEDTKNSKIHWEKEGHSYTFIAFSKDNCLYAITEQPDGSRVFDAINENGDTVCHAESSETKYIRDLDSLYDAIFTAEYAGRRSPLQGKTGNEKEKKSVIYERVVPLFFYAFFPNSFHIRWFQ